MVTSMDESFKCISPGGSIELQPLRVTEHFFPASCGRSFLYKGYIDMVREHKISSSTSIDSIVLSVTEK